MLRDTKTVTELLFDHQIDFKPFLNYGKSQLVPKGAIAFLAA
jgi:hypothetical protein